MNQPKTILFTQSVDSSNQILIITAEDVVVNLIMDYQHNFSDHYEIQSLLRTLYNLRRAGQPLLCL